MWGMTLESFAIAMVLAVAVTVMRVSIGVARTVADADLPQLSPGAVVLDLLKEVVDKGDAVGIEEFVPKASQQEFKTDEEARQALQQGRVDAYVIDNNMQQSALVREPGKSVMV